MISSYSSKMQIVWHKIDKINNFWNFRNVVRFCCRFRRCSNSYWKDLSSQLFPQFLQQQSEIVFVTIIIRSSLTRILPIYINTIKTITFTEICYSFCKYCPCWWRFCHFRKHIWSNACSSNTKHQFNFINLILGFFNFNSKNRLM